MTSPAGTPSSWSLGGRPVAEVLRRDRTEIIELVLAELRGPDHPDRARAAQLRWIVGYNLDLALSVIEHPDTELDEIRAADLVASAASRAADGSPIESLLVDYVGGFAAIWRVLAQRARPQELPELIDLTRVLLDYLRSVITLVVRGFQRQASRLGAGEGDTRFALYSALLGGTGVAQAAALAGVTVASRYLVLALRLGPAPDAGEPGRAAQVLEVRRAHTVRRVLDEFADDEVLTLLRDPVGTALVPLPAGADAAEEPRVRQLVQRLGSALGTSVHAGAVTVAAEAVPAAAVQAEELLELAVATGRPAGACFLTDVLIPYQLTRPGPARDLLADRMRALDSHPDWEATLRAYLDAGHDRRAAAEVLHVHPNTVDYRLGRIATACGVDATDSSQRSAALAALCIRDLDRHRS